jgi:hypothetical protein
MACYFVKGGAGIHHEKNLTKNFFHPAPLLSTLLNKETTASFGLFTAKWGILLMPDAHLRKITPKRGRAREA